MPGSTSLDRLVDCLTTMASVSKSAVKLAQQALDKCAAFKGDAEFALAGPTETSDFYSQIERPVEAFRDAAKDFRDELVERDRVRGNLRDNLGALVDRAEECADLVVAWREAEYQVRAASLDALTVYRSAEEKAGYLVTWFQRLHEETSANAALAESWRRADVDVAIDESGTVASSLLEHRQLAIYHQGKFQTEGTDLFDQEFGGPVEPYGAVAQASTEIHGLLDAAYTDCSVFRTELQTIKGT